MLEPTIDMHSRPSRFSWVAEGRPRGPSDLFDIPMFADRSSVVLPSIGGMVPGWSLVVPRRTACNLACLDACERDGLSPSKAFLVRALCGFPGDVYEFEHGPAQIGSLTGCGVDHAHLHMAPLPFDFVAAVYAVHGGQRFQADLVDPWSLAERDQDYWLVRNRRTGAGVIVYNPEPVSQGLRRVIANQLGLEAWDYRRFEFAENALKTRRAVAELSMRVG